MHYPCVTCLICTRDEHNTHKKVSNHKQNIHRSWKLIVLDVCSILSQHCIRLSPCFHMHGSADFVHGDLQSGSDLIRLQSYVMSCSTRRSNVLRHITWSQNTFLRGYFSCIVVMEHRLVVSTDENKNLQFINYTTLYKQTKLITIKEALSCFITVSQTV